MRRWLTRTRRTPPPALVSAIPISWQVEILNTNDRNAAWFPWDLIGRSSLDRVLERVVRQRQHPDIGGRPHILWRVRNIVTEQVVVL